MNDIDFYCERCGEMLESGSLYDFYGSGSVNIEPCENCAKDEARKYLELLNRVYRVFSMQCDLNNIENKNVLKELIVAIEEISQ